MAEKISVQGNEISIISREQEDYISLTVIAKYRNKQEPFAIINNWLRNRSTIEFLGLWEKLSNPVLNLSNSRGLKGKQRSVAIVEKTIGFNQ